MAFCSILLPILVDVQSRWSAERWCLEHWSSSGWSVDMHSVGMMADVGQQRWLCTFFRLSDRTLISRVKNFVIWQKSAEFQAEARLLVAAWVWAISWHGEPVQTAGTVREKAAYKSRAAWAFFSLGDYMQDSSHLRGSERAHQPDQGEVSSWRFRRA